MGIFAGIDYSALTAQNTANFKQVTHDQSTSYVQVWDVILIGGGHERSIQEAIANAEGEPNRGMMTKVGARELRITGCRTARCEMEEELKLFTERTITYIDPF